MTLAGLSDFASNPSRPRRIGPIRRWLGRTWLSLFGWRLVTETPPVDKFVFIAAPHTTGWDLPFMLATAYAMGVPISWLGKRELFGLPFGPLLRWLGGIPVDRGRRGNMVGQAAEAFAQASQLVLAVPPEGTRKGGGHWKSGFYHIARAANVPIGLGYLDYARRRCGVGGFVEATGDVRADMAKIRGFYADVRGKYPHLEGEPRLQEEDGD